VLHRVAVMIAGTLDTLPHNGAVVTLMAVCDATHRQSYGGIMMVGIIGPVLALIAVIALGTPSARSEPAGRRCRAWSSVTRPHRSQEPRRAR
jgi:hypothetical protein